jgi:hypothetical protein
MLKNEIKKNQLKNKKKKDIIQLKLTCQTCIMRLE